jgi:O-antigen ligase
VTYRPVVDQFILPVPLDAWSAAIFTALFIAAALLTSRRAAYGLCLLILCAPIALYRDVLGTTITLPKAVLLGVLLGLTTYPGNVGRLRARPAVVIAAALGIYLLATALTLLDAAHRGATLRETFKVAEYLALFVAAYLCYRLDSDDALVIGAVAIAAIVVALSALAQEIAGAPSGLYIGAAIVPRIAGLLEGPNQLAAYFEIATAALGAWALVRRSKLLDSALALALCADVLTFSRAGLVGLLVVAAVLTAVAGRAALRALRPVLIGVGAGLAGTLWWAIYAHSPIMLRASLEPSLYAGGVGNRGALWTAAWRMWLRRPLLGVGAGNYELELPQYGIYGIRTHANSWYLESLAEGGLLLFAATLALVATILASFSGKRVLERLRAGSPWVTAALAASLALVLHQIADYLIFYPKVGGPWMLLLGIAAGAMPARD